MKNFKRLSAVIAAGTASMALPGGAKAASLNTYLYLETGAYAGYAAMQNSTLTTGKESLRASVAQTIDLITDRIESVMIDDNDAGTRTAMQEFGTGKTAGMPAGNMRKFGMWVAGRYTDLKDKTQSTALKGHIASGVVGADYRVMPAALAGVSVGYQKDDLKTPFNSGTIKGDGWNVSPYAAFRFNNMFSLDVMGGYARLDKKTKRVSLIKALNPLAAVTDGDITGKTKATRWFGGGFINARHSIQKFVMAARAGYTYSHEDQKAFTESNGRNVPKQKTKLGTLKGNVRLGVNVMKAVVPYVDLGVLHDLSSTKVYLSGQSNLSEHGVQVGNTQSPENKKTAYTLGGGLNILPHEQVKGVLHFEHLKRGRFKSNSILGRLRFEM